MLTSLRMVRKMEGGGDKSREGRITIRKRIVRIWGETGRKRREESEDD